jgi:hypothetical protein
LKSGLHASSTTLHFGGLSGRLAPRLIRLGEPDPSRCFTATKTFKYSLGISLSSSVFAHICWVFTKQTNKTKNGPAFKSLRVLGAAWNLLDVVLFVLILLWAGKL